MAVTSCICRCRSVSGVRAKYIARSAVSCMPRLCWIEQLHAKHRCLGFSHHAVKLVARLTSHTIIVSTSYRDLRMPILGVHALSPSFPAYRLTVVQRSSATKDLGTSGYGRQFRGPTAADFRAGRAGLGMPGVSHLHMFSSLARPFNCHRDHPQFIFPRLTFRGARAQTSRLPVA